MAQQDERSLRLLIHRYEKKIFALVLYLAGPDKDKAYEIAAGSFAEAIPLITPLDDDKDILSKIAGVALERCRHTVPVPFCDAPPVLNMPPEQRESLRMVTMALQALPVDSKALLLLRDQLHLPYRRISEIIKAPEDTTRVQITKARVDLRNKLEDQLAIDG